MTNSNLSPPFNVDSTVWHHYCKYIQAFLQRCHCQYAVLLHYRKSKNRYHR